MKRHLLPIAIGVLAVVLAVVLRVADPWPIETTRLAVFDSYQRLKPRDDPPLPVRIVDIGDASLEQFGQWPWPRTVLSELVDKLIANGAAAIAFSMIFPEPDRTSPTRAIEIWPDTQEVEAIADIIAQLPDHDAVFARTLSGATVVLGFSATTSEGRTPPSYSGGIAFAGSDPSPFLPRLVGGLTSLPIIDEAAWGRGSLLLSHDIDGTVRRAPLLLTLDDEILPSLSVEALRAAQLATTLVTRTADASGGQSIGDSSGLTSIRVGEFIVPTTAHGEMWLYFADTEDDQSIEAWQVLDAPAPDADLSPLIAGHIVLIGTSAAGLFDLHETPLNPAMPGVAIHAQAIEQMISGNFLERPSWAGGAEMLLLVVIGVLLIVIIPLVGVVTGAVVGAVLALGSIYGSWLAFDQAGLLLDPVYPSIAVLIIYLMVSFLVYMRTERERGRVRNAFSRYLSPQLVKRVADNPQQLRLGGESRELTLLFSDIRGFTSFSENMSPEELTSFINSFLTPMTEIILEHLGTIDKYMGDAIMAFWNAPLDDADHAVNACRSALAMRDRLAELNNEWRETAEAEGRPLRSIDVGIGINSGECVVGNLGSDQRFDYSVLGDAVNLASRLEGQTKTYGTTIVVGESTQQLAPSLAYAEIDLIRVKGRSAPVRIFALVGAEDMATSQRFVELRQQQDQMLDAYRGQDWSTALDRLLRCRELDDGPLGGVLDLYQCRLETLRANPPSADWDGVYTAETK